jgi:two-component system CheB/CheR fusion protein
MSPAIFDGTTPAEIFSRSEMLIVEDHEPTAAALAGAMRRAGFCVTVAHSVAHAFRAADANQFSYLLCDINLPDGLGYQVMQHVRTRGSTRGIALAALCDREDYDASIAAGFEAHLVKPVSAGRILQILSA